MAKTLARTAAVQSDIKNRNYARELHSAHNVTAQTCPSSSAICEKFFLLPEQAQKWQRGRGRMKFSDSEQQVLTDEDEQPERTTPDCIREESHLGSVLSLLLKAHLQTVADDGLI